MRNHKRLKGSGIEVHGVGCVWGCWRGSKGGWESRMKEGRG